MEELLERHEAYLARLASRTGGNFDLHFELRVNASAMITDLRAQMRAELRRFLRE